MTRLPPALGESELPLAELCAACLDGLVYRVDDCFAPVDLPDSAVVRASALSHLVPPAAVAAGRSAAWIHGAASTPPLVHEIYLPSMHRTQDGGVRLAVREVRVREADRMAIGALSVLTPLKTLIDHARLSTTWGEDDRRVVAGLVAARGIARATWRRALTDERILYARRALDRIEEVVSAPPASAVADPVDVVDAVHPPHGVEHPVQMRRVAHLEHEPADRQAIA